MIIKLFSDTWLYLQRIEDVGWRVEEPDSRTGKPVGAEQCPAAAKDSDNVESGQVLLFSVARDFTFGHREKIL